MSHFGTLQNKCMQPSTLHFFKYLVKSFEIIRYFEPFPEVISYILKIILILQYFKFYECQNSLNVWQNKDTS